VGGNAPSPRRYRTACQHGLRISGYRALREMPPLDTGSSTTSHGCIHWRTHQTVSVRTALRSRPQISLHASHLQSANRQCSAMGPYNCSRSNYPVEMSLKQHNLGILIGPASPQLQDCDPRAIDCRLNQRLFSAYFLAASLCSSLPNGCEPSLHTMGP
jgi:hypothetical protein